MLRFSQSDYYGCMAQKIVILWAAFFFFFVAFIYILICNYCTSKALEGYYMRLYKQMHMHGATEKYIKFLT